MLPKVTVTSLEQYDDLKVGDLFEIHDHDPYFPTTGQMLIVDLLRISGTDKPDPKYDPVVVCYMHVQSGQMLALDSRQFNDDVRRGTFERLQQQ